LLKRRARGGEGYSSVALLVSPGERDAESNPYCPEVNEDERTFRGGGLRARRKEQGESKPRLSLLALQSRHEANKKRKEDNVGTRGKVLGTAPEVEKQKPLLKS